MADSQSKIDAAAEKAFAAAAEKKTTEAVTTKPVVAPAATPAPVAAKVAAPVAKPTAAPVAAKASAPLKKKPAPAKAKAKPVAKKAAKPANPALVKKIVAENKAAVAAAKPTTFVKIKDSIMTADYTAKAKELAADMQTRAKAAYDKGAELTADVTEFQKGNLEALVASGKILAAGLQDMGRSYVEEAKAAVETVQADVKKVAAVRTPTEFFQLQGEIARRNFDAVVATTSKNTETMLKLVNEAFAPVSSRMSLAAEKFSKAA